MKIYKTINGYTYRFYVKCIIGERKVEVRYFHGDESIVCDVSEDFKYIFLPINKFFFNEKCLKKLKLNKVNALEVMEYSSIKK